MAQPLGRPRQASPAQVARQPQPLARPRPPRFPPPRSLRHPAIPLRPCGGGALRSAPSRAALPLHLLPEECLGTALRVACEAGGPAVRGPAPRAAVPPELSPAHPAHCPPFPPAPRPRPPRAPRAPLGHGGVGGVPTRGGECA